MVRVFTNGPGNWGSIPYQRLKKWYLMLSYLTLSIIWYRSRVKGNIKLYLIMRFQFWNLVSFGFMADQTLLVI